MKKVIVFGTFDAFHKGHRNFLQQAKKFGDFLVAVVARDETVLKVKGVKTHNNEEKRKNEIEKSGLTDKVILGSLGDKYEVIRRENPNVICLGYDQCFFIDKLKDELKKMGLADTEIIRLKAYMPEKYKSSIIRKQK